MVDQNGKVDTVVNELWRKLNMQGSQCQVMTISRTVGRGDYYKQARRVFACAPGESSWLATNATG